MKLFAFILATWVVLTSANVALNPGPSTGNSILDLVSSFGSALWFALIPIIWAIKTPKESRSNWSDFKLPASVIAVLWLFLAWGRGAI